MEGGKGGRFEGGGLLAIKSESRGGSEFGEGRLTHREGGRVHPALPVSDGHLPPRASSPIAIR